MTMKRDRLQEFASAIAIPLHNTDGIKWPVRSGTVISEVGDIYALEYISQLEKLIHEFDPSFWHKAFSNSLSVWKVSHHIINGLNKAGIERRNIAKYISEMIDVLDVLSHGEPLLHSNHFSLEPIIIEKLCNNYPRITLKKHCEKIIDLSAILWAYADSIYFQGREICCEYHGPYKINGNKQLIIRDYQNLTPKELWPEHNFDYIADSIRIVTFHDASLVISFDVYNNTNIVHGHYKQSCFASLLFINNKLASLDAVEGLIDLLLTRIKKYTSYVNHMEARDLYNKYINIFWYRKRYLARMLGYEWNPPEEVFQRVNQMAITQNKINPHGLMSLSDVSKIYDYSGDL